MGGRAGVDAGAGALGRRACRAACENAQAGVRLPGGRDLPEIGRAHPQSAAADRLPAANDRWNGGRADRRSGGAEHSRRAPPQQLFPRATRDRGRAALPVPPDAARFSAGARRRVSRQGGAAAAAARLGAADGAGRARGGGARVVSRQPRLERHGRGHRAPRARASCPGSRRDDRALGRGAAARDAAEAPLDGVLGGRQPRAACAARGPTAL